MKKKIFFLCFTSILLLICFFTGAFSIFLERLGREAVFAYIGKVLDFEKSVWRDGQLIFENPGLQDKAYTVNAERLIITPSINFGGRYVNLDIRI